MSCDGYKDNFSIDQFQTYLETVFQNSSNEDLTNTDIYKFCNNRQILENLLFLFNVFWYKKNLINQQLYTNQKLETQIMKQFIHPGSKYEVNLPGEMREEIIKTYIIPNDSNIFDKAYNEIFKVLELNIKSDQGGNFYDYCKKQKNEKTLPQKKLKYIPFINSFGKKRKICRKSRKTRSKICRRSKRRRCKY